MRASMCLTAALAVVLCAAAIANADTTGQSLYGYGPMTTDVTLYYNLTADVRDVQTATNSSAPDFATVKTIYLQGKNAQRAGNYLGTNRTAKSIVENTGVNETYYDMAAAYYKDTKFLGTFLGSAVNGTVSPFIESAADYCCGARIETIRGGYRAFIAYYAIRKVDQAYNRRANVSIAVRSIDEAVGAWYGGALNGTGNALFGTANNRARRACTNKTATATSTGSVANDDFFAAAKAMRAAIEAGNDAGAMAARTNLYNSVMSVVLQAFLYNGNEAAVTPPGYLTITAPCITKCGIRKAKQAGALIYWRLVAPVLAKDSAADVTAITAAFLPTAPFLEPAKWEDEIKPKLIAAVNKAGIAWSSKVDACPASGSLATATAAASPRPSPEMAAAPRPAYSGRKLML